MGQESGGRTKSDGEARSSGDGRNEHQAFNTVVGGGIRRARQEHGWTQAFLADQAGLSPNYIARLERGELGPSLFVASRICEALVIPLEARLGAPASAKKTSTKRRANAIGRARLTSR